ncbi:MAG: DUF167 domain-containing protein [Pseudomonadota bacterium]|nr:DUF167 domain-containing protein [Pseudomonadota bacterium]
MDECLELWLRVQPGAPNLYKIGKGSVVGRYGDWIKIRVAAPAVDGKANVALIRFLAREFGVKQGQVRLADGARSRDKRVVIDGPVKRPAWWTGTAATRKQPPV